MPNIACKRFTIDDVAANAIEHACAHAGPSNNRPMLGCVDEAVKLLRRRGGARTNFATSFGVNDFPSLTVAWHQFGTSAAIAYVFRKRQAEAAHLILCGQDAAEETAAICSLQDVLAESYPQEGIRPLGQDGRVTHVEFVVRGKEVQYVNDVSNSLRLELTVTDPEVISELLAKPEGSERHDYAIGALRLGVLALKQVRGQVDAIALKREGEQLLANVQMALNEHRTNLDHTLVRTLKEYFDPESGRFNERVQRLLKKDGELETLLSRKVTAADSEMSRTLSSLVGDDSPLCKLLSPDDSNEFLKALQTAVSKELEDQRTHVLREFSLDNKESALSRLLGELTDKNGQLRKDLQEKIDALVKQFSFDDEQSALSRMSRTVATTNDAISKHLTLDDKDSALSRLRRELMDVLDKHGEANNKFQEEVRVTLEKMKARREEAAASTRHGINFEGAVFDVVQSESQRLKDIATRVGNSTGSVKNCKKGDVVVEMGPESATPCAKIVVEAKEDATYNLESARKEVQAARENRGAESGLFVFSKKTAPAGLEPLATATTSSSSGMPTIWRPTPI